MRIPPKPISKEHTYENNFQSTLGHFIRKFERNVNAILSPKNSKKNESLCLGIRKDEPSIPRSTYFK